MRIQLRQPISVTHRAEAGLCLIAVAAFGFWAMNGGPRNMAVAPFGVSASRAATTVSETENGWREFTVAQRIPDILSQATLPELNFQNREHIPVAKIDGAVFNGRLPETLWVKLDQPGNAFLIVETDAGTFVKALEDASPGFPSPCKLDAQAFGTLQGQPIYFDRDQLYMKSLWIVQDATANPARIPGWVQIPGAERTGSGIAVK